jgi:hypothetical protein
MVTYGATLDGRQIQQRRNSPLIRTLRIPILLLIAAAAVITLISYMKGPSDTILSAAPHFSQVLSRKVNKLGLVPANPVVVR